MNKEKDKITEIQEDFQVKFEINKWEQKKISVDKEDDLKSKSLEKISFNKFRENKIDSNLENNKIVNNRFITSKSYKNIEEKDNKNEPKEEKRRTWK